jgi:hypothetical protein
MQTSNIITLVKQAMVDHEQDIGPFLDDKDYEQWFVKYYMYYMDKSNLTATTPQNHKKNGKR